MSSFATCQFHPPRVQVLVTIVSRRVMECDGIKFSKWWNTTSEMWQYQNFYASKQLTLTSWLGWNNGGTYCSFKVGADCGGNGVGTGMEFGVGGRIWTAIFGVLFGAWC